VNQTHNKDGTGEEATGTRKDGKGRPVMSTVRDNGFYHEKGASEHV
jgi:hypothetical protein